MTDFEGLIERARAGDREARESLLARHLDGLRAYVRLHSGRELRTVESQSDLVQTVCREALQSLGDARCEDEPTFRQWLYTVARHKILGKVDFHRAQKRDVRRLLTSGGSESSLLATYATFCSPSEHVSQREQVAAVESAFDRLSEDHRRVLLDVCVLGRSHREVAAEMGRSEEALRQLLARARARLALELRSG
ncbi:MAG: RNA polymerase sigma factor [bacterium]|nr:RNA polymerase sigma factor [bacterium]